MTEFEYATKKEALDRIINWYVNEIQKQIFMTDLNPAGGGCG